MNTMKTVLDHGDDDDEMMTLSPIYKSSPSCNNHQSTMATPQNNNSIEFSPIIRRPTLQHQHSYSGHEEPFHNAGNSSNDHHHHNHHHHIHRAPSGRPYLMSRHLSMEDLSHNSINDHDDLMNQATPPPSLHNAGSFTQWPHNNSDQNHSHSFLSVEEHAPAFSPNTTITTSTSVPGDDAPRQQPPAQPSQVQYEETAEDRARREEEESIALAQMLMAEEAMASHRISADFLRMNSDQFSAEDFAALQNALREEEEEEEAEDGDDGVEEEGEESEMSYEALLRLGERIGDVKTDRWTMIAHKEISKLESFQYDPDNMNDEDKTKEDIDDSEIKCLVCQYAYDKGDQLRRLPCSHCFHKDCIDQWLQTKDICAYCRQSICGEDEKK